MRANPTAAIGQVIIKHVRNTVPKAPKSPLPIDKVPRGGSGAAKSFAAVLASNQLESPSL